MDLFRKLGTNSVRRRHVPRQLPEQIEIINNYTNSKLFLKLCAYRRNVVSIQVQMSEIVLPKVDRIVVNALAFHLVNADYVTVQQL